MTYRPADLGYLVRPPAHSEWKPPCVRDTAPAELRNQSARHRFGPPPLQRDTPLIMPDLASLARILRGLKRL